MDFPSAAVPSPAESPVAWPPTAGSAAGTPGMTVLGGVGGGGGALVRRGANGNSDAARTAPNGGRVWRASGAPLRSAPVAPMAAPAAKGGTRAAVTTPPSSITGTDDDGMTGGAASSGTPPMALPSAAVPSPAASPIAWPPTAGSASGTPGLTVLGVAGGGGDQLGTLGATGQTAEAGAEATGRGVWCASSVLLPATPVAPTGTPAADGGARAAVPPPPSSTTATDDDGVTGGAASSGTPLMASPSAAGPSPASSLIALAPTAGCVAATPPTAMLRGVGGEGGGLDRRGAPGSATEAGGEPNGGRLWRASCGPLPIAPVAPTAAPATKRSTRATLPPPTSSTTATDDKGVTGGDASNGPPPMAVPSADVPSPAASPVAWPTTAGSAAAPPVPAVMGGAGGGGGRRAGCGASGAPLVSLEGPRGGKPGDGAVGANCVPLSAHPSAGTSPPAAAALATIAGAAALFSFFCCIVARRFRAAASRFCFADIARGGCTGGWSLSPLVVLLVGSLAAMSNLESSESSFRSKNTPAESGLLRASR
ncbi:hypothetical protein BU14_0075s0004 [Porphyra umbilicalis]|uniref:Uncharacterized protein n=1 Tax=Porphyra umbilicalis TaxID=2786 RepID=A0A1X6PFR6_PORUM|nr:hypothetical protein BU14_0075s0004 [Porphyra umbilicalis]|eukprot:OSX79513.1 hypothetical protein BU14_0075s0004 [Porphyra umbilicalis]